MRFRGIEPSQNVDSIWIILQMNMWNYDVHEITENLYIDLIFDNK